jgi:hypothetical protein
MENRRDANHAPVGRELIENPVGPDAQRAQAAQPPAQLIARIGLPPEQPKGILDCVDQTPVKAQQRESSAAREDDPSHGSAGNSTLCQLLPQILKRNGLPPRKLAQANLDRRERVPVGEDLGRLLQRLVLVDRN